MLAAGDKEESWVVTILRWITGVDHDLIILVC